MALPLRLGVNIDHVATIRNARGGGHPDPVAAAVLAQTAGADGITLHVREDRRHVTEHDLERLVEAISLPINLEMAATEEMLALALKMRPHAACIVPERRAERTTEGGLDVAGQRALLAPMVEKMADAGIRVSLFIDPENAQIEASAQIKAPVVELHTGRYAEHTVLDAACANDLEALRAGAYFAAELGLEPHAGHGLRYDNVGPVAAIAPFRELNIGHFLIGEAVFVGLPQAIHEMKARMLAGRASA